MQQVRKFKHNHKTLIIEKTFDGFETADLRAFGNPL